MAKSTKKAAGSKRPANRTPEARARQRARGKEQPSRTPRSAQQDRGSQKSAARSRSARGASKKQVASKARRSPRGPAQKVLAGAQGWLDSAASLLTSELGRAILADVAIAAGAALVKQRPVQQLADTGTQDVTEAGEVTSDASADAASSSRRLAQSSPQGWMARAGSLLDSELGRAILADVLMAAGSALIKERTVKQPPADRSTPAGGRHGGDDPEPGGRDFWSEDERP